MLYHNRQLPTTCLRVRCQLYVTLVSLAVFIVPTIIISVCYVVIISVICRKAALLKQEPIVHWSASNSSQRLSRSSSQARRYPLRYGISSLRLFELCRKKAYYVQGANCRYSVSFCTVVAMVIFSRHWMVAVIIQDSPRSLAFATDFSTHTVRFSVVGCISPNSSYRLLICFPYPSFIPSTVYTPKPNYEAPLRLAYNAGGWLAGEIWFKSAGWTIVGLS